MNIKGNTIIDEWGRTLILRGCNLGGSSKLPASPLEASYQGPLSLKNPEAVSFTGRPFPVEEAEIHFRRLKSWGFTFLRFVITWEAIEHGGPGIYDEAYLAYLRKILLAAEKEGIALFLDPHQDVWSRWTGGDGAPAWTLEKLGMDLEALDDAGAAVTIQNGGELPECKRYWKKDGTPHFFWPVNYHRYGAATLFSLFFGGKTYAPEVAIEGKNAQDWFQERYIEAFRHCYRRLKNCKAVAGWGVMNEPSPGFIGCRDLSVLEHCVLPFGPMPSPWEAILAASGEAVRVSSYTPWINGRRKTGEAVLNPGKRSLFKEGFDCPWKIAGVWTDKGGEKRLLKKDHFARYEGKNPAFADDFLKPFILKFIERMKDAERPALFFVEGVAQGEHPSWQEADGGGVVNAFHCYEGLTMYTKRFRPYLQFDETRGKLLLGRKKASAYYAGRLEEAGVWTREKMGGIPGLLGEFGLPFDLNNRDAFKTGDYSAHEEALSRYYDAVDKELLHSTIWNYTADNTHERGDFWNGEDFSIFSNGFGRARKGWQRPYPRAVPGRILEIRWDRKTHVFCCGWKPDFSIKAPAEFYIPAEWFGQKVRVTARCSPQAGADRGPSVIRYEYNPAENRLVIEGDYDEPFDGTVRLFVSPERKAGKGKNSETAAEVLPEGEQEGAAGFSRIQSGTARLSPADSL